MDEDRELLCRATIDGVPEVLARAGLPGWSGSADGEQAGRNVGWLSVSLRRGWVCIPAWCRSALEERTVRTSESAAGSGGDGLNR
jgi:hypothetical protein